MCVSVVFFCCCRIYTYFVSQVTLFTIYSTQQELKFLFIAAATERMSD